MTEVVRINLGAGLQSAPGWINYDRTRSVLIANRPELRAIAKVLHRIGLTSKDAPLEWPKSTRIHDLTRGIPHERASVDVIYSSHFLEHVPPQTARFILEECFRVLKPGGCIRLAVPDLRKAAQAYLDGEFEFFGQPDAPTTADAFVASLHLRENPKGGRIERAARRFILRSDEGGHKWMYDGESLMERLATAGFADIESCSYRQGRCAEAAALDSRPRDSVFLEASRPPNVLQ